MTFVNNISQNYSSNAINFNNSSGDGVRELKLSFTPEELGVRRGRDGKYPPEARFAENQAEKALFKFFGLNPDNPQDFQRIKARLQTSDSPFAKLKTTNNHPARFNSQTGKYEAVFQIDTKTYAQLRGQIAEIKNDPPVGKTSKPLTAPDPNDFYARQQKAKIEAKLPPTRLETESLTPEQKELLLDLTDLGLSVIGIFEPTPFSDLAGTGLALSRGEYGGAAISALGMIPYLGDLAKLGKFPKLVKVMEAVVSMAKTDGKFAKLVEPLLKNLKKALDALPIEKLPQKAQDAIKSIKNKIDEFFSAAKKLERTEPSLPPNPNRVPEGNPKKPGKNDKDLDNLRSITRENESAKILAENGYKVKQLPDNVKGSVQKVKKPDFEIEGKVFDNYAPDKNKNARGIWSTLRDKIVDPKTGVMQADRFVVNLNDSKLTLEELTKQFKDYPLKDLQEIILIKDGKVIHFFPFKK